MVFSSSLILVTDVGLAQNIFYYIAKIHIATSYIAVKARYIYPRDLKVLENPNSAHNLVGFKPTYTTGEGAVESSQTVRPVWDDVVIASITR